MKLLDAFIMGYGSQVTIHVYWPIVCKNFINSFFSQLKLVIMDIFNSRRIIFIGRHHNNASQKKLKLKLIVNVSLITYKKNCNRIITDLSCITLSQCTSTTSNPTLFPTLSVSFHQQINKRVDL